MVRSIALLALSGAAVLASQDTSTTIVKLLMPYADSTAVVHASVVAADPKATTYAVSCPKYHGDDEDPEDCGMGTATATLVQGPSTFAFAFSAESDGMSMSEGYQCSLTTVKNRDAMDCTMSASYIDEDGIHKSSSTAAIATDYQDILMPVTVTAGVQKLAATATPGASEATVTQTGSVTSFVTSTASGSTTVKAPTSAVITTSSVASTGLPSSNSTSGPHTTNAAGAMNPQNALLAGFAAIIGGVLLL